MAKRQKPKAASSVQPDTLYTLQEFFKAAGIGYSTIAKAKQAGVRLDSLKVGRRKYVRGNSGIEFIEQLAAIAAEKAAS